MPLLQFLWAGSWIAALAASSWMILLIAARVVHDRLQAGRAKVRAGIIQAYLELMNGDLDALGRLRKGQAAVMAEALLNVLDMVRGAERERLIESLDAFGLDRMLQTQLQKGDATSRLAAIEALATFPGPRTEAALRRMETTRDPELRLAAVKSLLSIGAHVDLPALLEEIRRRRDPWAGSLIDTFKLLAERQPGDCAAAFARTDLPEPVRVMLANALGTSGDYKILPVLAEAAMAGPPRVRAAGVKALGRLMHPAAEPVLARGAVDPEPSVRIAAAMAIGDTGLSALTPQLLNLLWDPSWAIRFQAAEALAKLGPKGRDVLREVARSGTDDAAEMAAMTLAERGLT